MSETSRQTPPREGAGNGSLMTFWDHLDELRAVIIRALLVTVVAAAVAFCLKEELFAFLLWCWLRGRAVSSPIVF